MILRRHFFREDTLRHHPTLELQGTGRGRPEWVIRAYEGLARFIDRNLLSASQFSHR